MLLTVAEFRHRVRHGLRALVEELTEVIGRRSTGERRAWQRSLPRLADALDSPSLARLHIHFQSHAHHVSLEYQLPGTGLTCDVVLLGRMGERKSAIVFELKDWDTSGDQPGRAPGLIERRGSQELHPSDQVRGYVEYCQRFHAAVLDHGALVHGCVLFTSGLLKDPYIVEPNQALTDEFPVFTMVDVDGRLSSFVASRLTESDEEFATAFATGTFRQDRGFMSQIGRAILDGDTRQFELLDNQRLAFHLTLARMRPVLSGEETGRRVILIEGPPGSGKSAVAARLWAELVVNPAVPAGNVLLVTTSMSQSSNWVHLIDQATQSRTGRGVARKASSFSPLATTALGRLRGVVGDKNLYKKGSDWRDHLDDMKRRGISVERGAESDSVLISLVDEAHALINPEREYGTGRFGFATGLGPQAYHIMRCSRVTVFFLDPEQSFRVRENTRIGDIEQWAKELGAIVERVSLEGAQFRCAGSAEYVAWVQSLLSGASEETNGVFASAWYVDAQAATPGTNKVGGNVIEFPRVRTAENTGKHGASTVRPYHARRAAMDFRVYSDPFQMEQDLRSLSARHSARLVSTYSRPWKTERTSNPHRLPPEGLDFCEAVASAGGERRVWSRPWNFAPKGDYTGIVAGRIGLPIHDDPLCEVGCTYAVRGFDFDYVGLLWLDDLVWRDGKWQVPLANVHESGIKPLLKQARHEGEFAPAGPKGANVLEKVQQAYRILLTRAIRGLFVWIPDEQTRIHVMKSLDEVSGRTALS